jgi:c-di-GMP-related signal transduction protein
MGGAGDLAAHPLLSIASYVEIDVQQHDEDARRSLFRPAAPTFACGPSPRRSRPAMSSPRRRASVSPTSRASSSPGQPRRQPVAVAAAVRLLDLLAKLSQPECEFEDIEAPVRLDVGLSYRVLRAVDSAEFGLRRKIS